MRKRRSLRRSYQLSPAFLANKERSAAIEGAAASGAEEGQTRVGEEDASRGARATRTRRLTRRARFVLTERCRRFGNDALHVAGKKKTRLRRRNASRVVASRGWVGGRRRAVVGPPARGGKRGGDVPGRNTCAISRHLSSARSNGRNDLPRPRRIWTRRLCFVFAPKSANSSERKPRACSTFQIVWYDESLSYEPCRTEYSSCQNERLGWGEYFRDRESARAWHDLDSGYFFHCVCLRSPELFRAFRRVSKGGSRPTLCADRTRAHVAARDHARGKRAREPPTPFGLGGGGVARCTAPGTARPPSAAATDTAVPKRRLFPSRVESGSRA